LLPKTPKPLNKNTKICANIYNILHCFKLGSK